MAGPTSPTIVRINMHDNNITATTVMQHLHTPVSSVTYNIKKKHTLSKVIVKKIY